MASIEWNSVRKPECLRRTVDPIIAAGQGLSVGSVRKLAFLAILDAGYIAPGRS